MTREELIDECEKLACQLNFYVRMAGIPTRLKPAIDIEDLPREKAIQMKMALPRISDDEVSIKHSIVIPGRRTLYIRQNNAIEVMRELLPRLRNQRSKSNALLCKINIMQNMVDTWNG